MTGEKDRKGEVWEHFYLCAGNFYICERFLDRVIADSEGRKAA